MELALLWWTGVVLGVGAVVAALAMPRHRTTAWWVAAGAFGLAGVLGILSIGLVFLVAAVGCAMMAVRGDRITAGNQESTG